MAIYAIVETGSSRSDVANGIRDYIERKAL
jgi:hypothetical protein